MMIRTFSLLLLLFSANSAFADTAQDQYIKFIVAEEAKERFAINESITVDMFQKWFELGGDSKKNELLEGASLVESAREASDLCEAKFSSLDMLICYSELSDMTTSLLIARMQWLEEQGYEVSHFFEVHQYYSELMCNGLVDLDYGDLVNNYSQFTYISCSLDYMKNFMDYLSYYHGASFR